MEKDSHLCIINTDTFKIEVEIKSQSQIKCIQPFKSNKYLLLGEYHGHIEIFKIETREIILRHQIKSQLLITDITPTHEDNIFILGLQEGLHSITFNKLKKVSDEQSVLNGHRIISIVMIKPQLYAYLYVGSDKIHFFNFD